MTRSVRSISRWSAWTWEQFYGVTEMVNPGSQQLSNCKTVARHLIKPIIRPAWRRMLARIESAFISSLQSTLSKHQSTISELKSSYSEQQLLLSELKSSYSEQQLLLSELKSSHSKQQFLLSELKSSYSEQQSRLSKQQFRLSALEADGEGCIIAAYREIHGRPPNIDSPTTFSEKLCQRMVDLHRYGDPVITRLSDKILVRDFVSSRIGSAYLTQIVWAGPDPSGIPFDRLPPVSMGKTNHDSGGHLRLVAPFNREFVIQWFRDRLASNYYWASREAQYYTIEKQVFIEGIIDDGTDGGPRNYKFWCFWGKVACVHLINDSHTINQFYDMEWNRIDLAYRSDHTDVHVERPDNFYRMLDVAAELSRDFGFVRVDLYNVRGHIYFGELTFTPTAGKFRFSPIHWDRKFGEMWSPSPRLSRKSDRYSRIVAAGT